MHLPVGKEDSRAKPMYHSIGDIRKMFDENPGRLADYVASGLTNSFGKKTKIHEALAEEITLAYHLDSRSNALSKKLELERQADASR